MPFLSVLFIYWIPGVVGSLASANLDAKYIVTGASNAVCGLLGASRVPTVVILTLQLLGCLHSVAGFAIQQGLQREEQAERLCACEQKSNRTGVIKMTAAASSPRRLPEAT